MNRPKHAIYTGEQYENGVVIVEFISNRQTRFTLSWHELTDAERAEFDYLETEEAQDCATFVRYKDCVYDLGEFTRIEPNGLWGNAGWHGTQHDSAFSGVVVHLCGDGDSVIMGQYRS